MKKFMLSIIFSALFAHTFAQTPPPGTFAASATVSGDVLDIAVDHFGHTGHACVITGIENGGANNHSAALISFIDSTGAVLAQETVVPSGGISAYLNSAVARNFPGVFSVMVNGFNTTTDSSSIYDLEYSITGNKLSETSSLISGNDTVSDFQYLAPSLRLFAFFNNNNLLGTLSPMYGIVNTGTSTIQYSAINRKNTKTVGVTVFQDTTHLDSIAAITTYNAKTDLAALNTYIINSAGNTINPADSFSFGKGFPYESRFTFTKLYVGIADNFSSTHEANMLRFGEDGLIKRSIVFAESTDPLSNYSISSQEKIGSRVLFSYNNLNADSGYVVAGPKRFDSSSDISVLYSVKSYSVDTPLHRTWCNEVVKYDSLDNLALYTSDGNLLDVNRMDSGLNDLWTGPYVVNNCAGYRGSAQIQQITNGFFLVYTTDSVAAPELTTRFEYVFENLTGVQPVSQAQKITVYPNPVSKTVLVQTHTSIPVVISIYDVTGKLIYSNVNVRQQVMIDLVKFASGVYMLHVVNGNSTQTVKLVKQ